MATQDYLRRKVHVKESSVTDVNDLIQRVQQEKKKEKRKSIIYVAAAVSAIAISGLIITLWYFKN